MTATYHNQALNETYKLTGIDTMEKAVKMHLFVCSRNGWNVSMFNYDVKITIA